MLSHDLRYGLRLIRRAPGFSAVAIASLAVGIGAATVIFSFANSLLFRPVQAANPAQLVQVFTSTSRGTPYGASSYADYENYRAIPVFNGLLASRRARAAWSADQQHEVINGLLVSGNYFDVLGLRPSMGRFFSGEENRTPGAHPVIVISHDGWRRRFGADPGIIGRAVELNGRAFSIIGVGPRRFVGTHIEDMADFFAPAMMQAVMAPGPDLLRDRRQRGFRILGRLKPGVTLAQAAATLQVTASQLLQQDPASWTDQAGRARVITALPETRARFVGAGPGAEMFIVASVLGGAGALLAIACVNVATVLLARAAARRKEIAVRLAIGASRWRMVRQLLAECALLAAAGGILGLVIAQAADALFRRFRPAEMPVFDLTLDYRILLFSIAASLLTVVFFGLAPALQTTRPDLQSALKDTERAVRVRGLRFGLRGGLVVIQVALSLALLIGAALMLRSAHAGGTQDPGFRRDDILSVGIDLATIPDRPGAYARFYQDAVRTVEALPGVERAALAALVPMNGSNSQTTIRIVDGGRSLSTSPDINVVGPGYFGLLDIPLTRGRECTAADRTSTPGVAVVNETMARHYWKGEPVGQSFIVDNTGERVEIVGVVRDLRHRSFSEDPMAMVYFCANQRVRPQMTLHVRTKVPPRVLGPVLPAVLHEIDRAAGLTRAETMHDYFARVTLPQRLGGVAAMATAGLELSLALMALYGVIAFAVSQRRREIGVRMALGASGRSVTMLFMREGLLLTGTGVVLGVGIGLIGGAALGSLLIGIGPADPASLGGAVLVLLVVGVAASYIPSRKALRVNPWLSLRSE